SSHWRATDCGKAEAVPQITSSAVKLVKPDSPRRRREIDRGRTFFMSGSSPSAAIAGFFDSSLPESAARLVDVKALASGPCCPGNRPPEDRYPAECAVRLWNFDRGWVEIGLRELEVKRFESIDDGLGHQQIAEPVFLGGDDVPRSVIGRTVAEGFL